MMPATNDHKHKKTTGANICHLSHSDRSYVNAGAGVRKFILTECEKCNTHN